MAGKCSLRSSKDRNVMRLETIRVIKMSLQYGFISVLVNIFGKRK